MIIQTGMRTDIPAFYAEWLENRLKEGFVLVRNPYNPISVTRYELSPDVVDLITFCTKNPQPMLGRMNLLQPYRQYWFVTITPYGKEIEPAVLDKEKVMDSFIFLSRHLGKECIGWRYDPVFISEKYTVDFHIDAFEKMASRLAGYTEVCVISFIDLYEKVRRNFPEAKSVEKKDRLILGKAFVEIGRKYGMVIKTCGEGRELEAVGADCSGCMTEKTYEKAVQGTLHIPKRPELRKECACFLGNDIGAYNSCAHFCKYCYANYDRETVLRNRALHDPKSPFLIGNATLDDQIHQAKQESWVDGQMRLDL